MSSKVKQSVSRLQARMIEDMTARGLQSKTQTGHIRSCRRFAVWLGRSPDTATPEDVRRFQLDLAANDVSIPTRNAIMTGIKFLFRTTLRRHDLVAEVYYPGEPQKIPPVMSWDEVSELLDSAKALKAKTMLSLACGCGLRSGEVVRLKVGDIDSGQGIIRIVQSKGRKDRHVMLPHGVLELLRQYWCKRSKRYDTGVRPEQRYVFPGRGSYKPLSTRQLNRLFHQAAEAGLNEEAIQKYEESSRLAVVQSAFEEAAVNLQKTISLSSKIINETDRGRTEFSLQAALGRVFMALYGYGSPEAEAAYLRAFELSKTL